jgi:hypothetical protein
MAYGAGPALYAAPFQPQNPAAFALFMAVDRDRSGQVNVGELQAALSNGGFTAFSPRTTRLLMRMYDRDRSGAYSPAVARESTDLACHKDAAVQLCPRRILPHSPSAPSTVPAAIVPLSRPAGLRRV